MNDNRFDLIAIGGGTAGLVTAAGGAGLGARVALIERDRMGGECLWNGCVPSKALIAAARAAHDARAAARFGVETGKVHLRLDTALAHVRAVQERIAPHDSPERFRSLGVRVIQGEAAIEDPGSVVVDGTRYRARNIVIATGTRPAVPPIPGLAESGFHTNETIFGIERLPRALVVIGGGPIGVELAQAFSRLGSEVHIVEELPAFFSREDPEVASMLQQHLEREGIQFHLGARATAVRRNADAITVTVGDEGNGSARELAGDALLVAVGRRPNLDALGLDRVGVRTDRGGVVTDGKLRTSVRGIFAAGDIVSGGLKFTHVADHMARAVLRNALFPGASHVDYSAVPWVTYTDPELARVGLTEAEARDRFGADMGVWRREVGAVDRSMTDLAPAGLVKIVTDHKGRVVGGHILASHAGDLIGELTIAVKHRLTVAQLGSVIHPYPTTAEAIKQAAEQRMKAGFTGWKKRLVRMLVNRV
ncbi:MAG: FAD-dependent oxidoreductase [Gemmatimonadaceae bacterium]